MLKIVILKHGISSWLKNTWPICPECKYNDVETIHNASVPDSIIMQCSRCGCKWVIERTES